jgi:hypothetical protein
MQPVISAEIMQSAMQFVVYLVTLIITVAGVLLAARA